jgi:hypothetical protein
LLVMGVAILAREGKLASQDCLSCALLLRQRERLVCVGLPGQRDVGVEQRQ